ncbi:PREDICTED: receptor [Prunus dulcis]|uniref:PREDICTED: receptor n=1 Tax=Prunus dulcis TaxID=3755 RepID=A0A5E4FEV7_PRUDU|nr:receptor-like protein 2 [Prunus dulcis]VVA25659.1 PREDICTED: receptor [Prunus dulcis]
MAQMTLSFLAILFFSYFASTNHACHQIEKSSLMSFFLTLSSPPLNWTSMTNCCYWEGITCNQDGWITRLHLPSKGLKGGIHPSLGNLTHLTHLNLSHNSLYCPTSKEIEFFLPLNRLEILDLSDNLLSGELPLSLPSNIQIVDLSTNHFHGVVPSSFFQQARNLTSFNVSNNTFSGPIPSFICPHSSPLIKLLDFSYNKFSGNISRGLGECSTLQVFRAGNNNLSGLLPEDIYNATTLQEIVLPVNLLHGTISDRIVNLTNLAILNLYYNQLSGVLPFHIGKLSKLKLILLHFNYLEGSLPPTLMNCTNLIELHIGDNNLEGDISALNFSKLGQLSKLDLWSNNFTGTIPMSLYSCKYLKAIRLSLNDLEGQIQPEIISLKSLSFLSLSGNKWTNITGAMKILMRCESLVYITFSYSFIGEEIPADDGLVGFDGFKNLRILSLCGCELTGQIPLWFSKLKKLEILNLDLNRFTGSIPSWLGTLPRLFYINLGSNFISGEFPKQLCRLAMLLSDRTAAQVDHNYLELPIFIRLRDNVKALQYNYLFYFPPSIYLYNNSISGNVPTEIGQLRLLHKLDLSFNNLSGSIPDQISNLKDLDALDLSLNHLTGKIPDSLKSLNFLSYLNVSYNDLEGPIPTSTQLQSFNASAFEGNQKLCGAPLPNECGLVNGSDADNKNSQDVDDEHHIPWFFISFVSGYIVGFWGVCGSLILKTAWRYRYFQFLDNVQDRLYVLRIMCMTMMRRRLRT